VCVCVCVCVVYKGRVDVCDVGRLTNVGDSLELVKTAFPEAGEAGCG